MEAEERKRRGEHYISVRTEIILIFLVFSAIILGVFLTIYNHNINELRRMDLKHLTENNRQLAEIANSIITDMGPLFQIHYEDTKLRNILADQRMSHDEKTRFENTTYVENTIAHGISGNEYIIRCSIFTETGDVYSNVSSVFDEYKEYIWNLIQSGEVTEHIYYTGVNRWSIGLVERDVITAIKVLYNYNGTSPLAWVVMDIDYEKLKELLEAADACTGTFLMCNDVILFSDPAENLSEEQLFYMEKKVHEMADAGMEWQTVSAGNQKYLMTAIKSANTQWVIGRYVAEKAVLQETMQKQARDISILLFTAAFVFFVYYYRISHMTEPLRKLDRVVKNSNGRLLEKVYLTEKEKKQIGNNEILTVMQNYNAMAERLNEYTEKILQYRISQKEAQIKMLTYQINPHFLYNTLNTISAMAEIENITPIVRITESISNIFRYSLREDTIVSLREELNYVRDYIQIQTYRFPGKFQVEYHIPEELEHIKIMKFIIQPLVENSISHGLFERAEGGRIILEARMEQDEGQMLLIVKDNGAGINRKHLEQINERLSSRRLQRTVARGMDGNGIGIMNVNARIAEYYGGNCGITIYSRYGEGTEAVIRLNAGGEESISEDSDSRG